MCRITSNIASSTTSISNKRVIFTFTAVSWRLRDQDLMFSWPVSSPFAILHVNLGMPVHPTDNNGNMALMNEMHDMSEFVVIFPVLDESYTTLASYFM